MAQWLFQIKMGENGMGKGGGMLPHFPLCVTIYLSVCDR